MSEWNLASSIHEKDWLEFMSWLPHPPRFCSLSPECKLRTVLTVGTATPFYYSWFV